MFSHSEEDDRSLGSGDAVGKRGGAKEGSA